MRTFFLSGISLAAMLAFAPLAQAQSAINADEVKGSIVFYTHWTNYITSGDMDRWEAEFKALYPNVEDIDVQGIATYAETMATRMATGEYGDVLEVATALTNEELGDFLLPLNDMGLDDQFYFADRWAHEGNSYAYTFGVNAEGVVYNKDAFAKAGITEIPQTLSEFYAAAEKLKAAGITPVVTNLGSGWPVTVFDGLASAISGSPNFFSEMVDDTTPFAADHPYGQSLSILRTLIDKGLVEQDLTGDHWQESKGWMASGEAAMWVLGNWSINQIIDEGAVLANVEGFSGEKIGFFPLPYDDSGVTNANSGPDWAMAVSNKSQNPVLAKAWVDFLLTKSDLSQIAGFIPGYKGLEPTLPQLAEFNSYEPNLIGQNPSSSEFTEAKNLIGFENGAGTRDLMNQKDFAAAITALNDRWVKAVERVRR